MVHSIPGLVHFTRWVIFKEALADFDKALEFLQTDAVIFANRGTTNYALGKYDAALKDFNQAVQDRPRRE